MWKDISEETWNALKSVACRRMDGFQVNSRGSEFLYIDGKLAACRYKLVGTDTLVIRASCEGEEKG